MALLLLVIGFITIFFPFIRWLIHYLSLRKTLSVIPGPENRLFLGLSLKLIKVPREDRLNWFTDLCFKFENGMVVTWVGTLPVVTIRKPQQLEVILPSNSQLTKAKIYDNLRLWLGDGLVTSTGEIWFTHRRLITPAFHFAILEEYACVMREKIQIFNDCIEATYQANPKAPINIFDLAIKYTLDTICETAMGVNLNCQQRTGIPYVKALHDFSRIISERIIRPWLSRDFIFYRTQNGKDLIKATQIMHEFTEKVIVQKQKERQEKKVSPSENNEDHNFGKPKRKAFLDLLLDECDSHKNVLNFKGLREEVDTFMFAGHDTTSAAISWALFSLGNAPEVQKKVHDELQQVFGNSTEVATTKQLGQLKYMDRVIKETLRLYPSAPQVSRKLDNDVVIDGCLIPKDTIVSLNIYQVHHDPQLWKNPETFDPDRFLPENSLERHPYTYIPFSAGPRNCIGQKFALLEVKTALTGILRRWRVKSVMKPNEIKKIVNFILRPHNDQIYIHFIPINNN